VCSKQRAVQGKRTVYYTPIHLYTYTPIHLYIPYTHLPYTIIYTIHVHTHIHTYSWEHCASADLTSPPWPRRSCSGTTMLLCITIIDTIIHHICIHHILTNYIYIYTTYDAYYSIHIHLSGASRRRASRHRHRHRHRSGATPTHTHIPPIPPIHTHIPPIHTHIPPIHTHTPHTPHTHIPTPAAAALPWWHFAAGCIWAESWAGRCHMPICHCHRIT
jgi:hypothetical protein